MTSDVALRDVSVDDLPVFFEQQRDPVAKAMVAFAAEDRSDRDAFSAKWTRILADQAITKRTVLFDGLVAGNILSFLAPWSGQLEIGYWIGREYWGKGIATRALSLFLEQMKARPLCATVAKDNIASLRVLEKCGFAVFGHYKEYSNARGEEVEELILKLSS